MTTPEERSHAVKEARAIMFALADALGRKKSGNAATVKIPLDLLRLAASALRHMPTDAELQYTHDTLPHLWGSVESH